MKRSLAYPIKKEEEAFLTTFEFEMESNKIEELEKLLKSAKGILRYLIIRKKKPQQKPTTPPEEKSKKKVKISQLDEKLKEILGENESK
jgi:ribosomal protein S6